MANKVAYKGTDSKGQCRGFQYEVGEEYSTDEKVSLCNKGFHACENPFDVFNYYDPSGGNRFFEVEQGGNIQKGDNKTVASKITIKAELSLKDLLKAGFKFIFEKVKISADTKNTSGDSAHANTSGYRAHANTSGYSAHANTSGYSAHANTSGDRAHANTSGYSAHANTSGYSAHANTSGYRAHANTSGYSAHANTSGDSAHANTSGKESVACALGIYSKAMVSKGWIIIVDWREDKEGKWFIEQIYHAKVGERIKCKKILPDVWYWFEGGKLKSEK
jgi:hypothetical protein